MSETVTSWKNRLADLLDRFPEWITGENEFRGDLTLCVVPKGLLPVVRHLKEPLGFSLLVDLFGMDYSRFPEQTGLAVVYILYNLSEKKRVRLKVLLSEECPAIDSISSIFAAANWFEREAYDLFGIGFHGHPNLIRILCHQEFQGHPLRKDYPADGYQRLKNTVLSTEL